MKERMRERMRQREKKGDEKYIRSRPKSVQVEEWKRYKRSGGRVLNIN